jgi:CRISPR-associated endonuclease Csn1
MAPVNVQPVNGKVTAHLRKLWGLNHILGDTGEKNRADHRHHAIDALTIACTHPGVTNHLSRYWQIKDDPR